MKAIILAAGKGSRLSPLTDNTPKPLLKIQDKAILDHIIDALPDQIDEVIVVTKYLKEEIEKHIQDEFKYKHLKNIVCVNQSEKSGTFGALYSCKDLIQEGERFLVLNGDDLHNKNELTQFLNFPLSAGVQKRVMPGYYACVQNEKGELVGFRSQNKDDELSGVDVATGTYLLDSRIFTFEPVEINGGELGLPQTIMKNIDKFPINVVVTKDWHPINTIENLKEAEEKVKNQNNV